MNIIKDHNAIEAIIVCVTITKVSNGKLKRVFDQCEQRDGRQHRRICHVGSFLPEESEDDDGA